MLQSVPKLRMRRGNTPMLQCPSKEHAPGRSQMCSPVHSWPPSRCCQPEGSINTNDSNSSVTRALFTKNWPGILHLPPLFHRAVFK